jgi:hypothetical protein
MRLGGDRNGLGDGRSGWDAGRSGLSDLRAGNALGDGRQHRRWSVDEGWGLPGGHRGGCGGSGAGDGVGSVDLDAGALEELTGGLLTLQGGGAAGYASDALSQGGRSDGDQSQRDDESSGHTKVLRRMRVDGKLEVTSSRNHPRRGRKKGKTISTRVTRRKTMLTRALSRKKAMLTQLMLRRRAMKCSSMRHPLMRAIPTQ